jgi:hypothetical protein
MGWYHIEFNQSIRTFNSDTERYSLRCGAEKVRFIFPSSELFTTNQFITNATPRHTCSKTCTIRCLLLAVHIASHHIASPPPNLPSLCPTFCSKPPTVPSSPYRIPPNPPAAAPIAPSLDANLGYFSWTCVQISIMRSTRITYKGKGINVPPTASSSPQHNSTHSQSRPPYATTPPRARNTSTPQ